MTAYNVRDIERLRHKESHREREGWKGNYTVTRPALQMKGRWQSNINVWFPYMYYHKWNCYFQNRIKNAPSPRSYTHISVRDLYISRIDLQILHILLQGNMWTDPGNMYINRSQIHECKNWEGGRAIPRKGIHSDSGDFLCSAAVQGLERL
jgi:hypothetical protein